MPALLLTHNVLPAAWPGVVLAALVLAAALGPRFGRGGGVVLGLLAGLWLVVNGRFEGGVLVTFRPGIGLTSADLAGVTGLALATWLLARGRL